MDLVDATLELTQEGEHPLVTEEWLASRVLECVADPRAVCRLALVNKNFAAASVSDPVWQKLLPPSAILDPLLAHVDYKPLSKKHLFFYLCKSITYEEGLKKFWLDPATGGECHMISAKALSIVWGDTPEYWEWKPHPASMFSKVAYLRTVCWLEVNGTFKYLSRPGWYTISFRLQLHSNIGWERVPVKLRTQNATYAQPPHESEVFFDRPSFKIRSCPSSNMFETKANQQDNIKVVHSSSNEDPHIWGECDVGEFFVEDDNENRPIEVHFSMQEIEVGRWKGGLFLDGVIIRPSYVIDERKRALPM